LECQWIPLRVYVRTVHKDDVVPIVTKQGSTAEEAQFGGPTRNPDGLISTTEPPIGVDVTAELTAPPQDAAPQPAPVAPQAALAPVAAATSSEAIRQLETLARVAVVSGRDSSDQASGRLRKNLTFLPWEPSISVSPRDQLTSERPSIGRPTFLTLALAFPSRL